MGEVKVCCRNCKKHLRCQDQLNMVSIMWLTDEELGEKKLAYNKLAKGIFDLDCLDYKPTMRAGLRRNKWLNA